jgi:hypothetical protein
VSTWMHQRNRTVYHLSPRQGITAAPCRAVATAPRCIHVETTLRCLAPRRNHLFSHLAQVLVGGCPYAEGAAACQIKKNPGIFRFWGCFGIIVLLLAATLSSTPLCWQFHAAIFTELDANYCQPNGIGHGLIAMLSCKACRFMRECCHHELFIQPLAKLSTEKIKNQRHWQKR